ncbi:MAG: beta-hydroxyacyl-ACP dehydratase [Candidatus Omnitrophota bacterium]
MLLEEINIENILPQAHPFIMIDRVVDFKKGEYLTAVKNVTANEWFFKNAGPMPYLPETLLIEAAAQTAVLFARLTLIENHSGNYLFVLGRINAEFEGRAGVGDQVLLKTSNFKMMKMNGFIDVGIESETGAIAKLNIFYSLMENKPHG